MINYLNKTNHKIDNFLNRLLKDLDLTCLDFSKRKFYIISINLINIQLGSTKKRIPLKKDIKIKIEKNDLLEEYKISQEDFDLCIISKLLNNGLKEFQTTLFLLYKSLQKKESLDEREIKLNNLFQEIF